jgi:hypothetical protein
MLVLIEGTYGSGKTLLATKAALSSDVPVLSNFKLNVPLYEPLDLSELADIKRKCLVILDEAYVYLESRTSGRDVNRYMSYMLFQSRKRGIDFILTEQLNTTIDVRYRDMTDLTIRAKRHGDDFTYSIYHPGEVYGGTWVLTKKLAEKLFPLYDTTETVETPQDMGKELSMVDPANVQKVILKIIDDLENEGPLDTWSKPMIADYALEHRYPKKYVDLVYSRIKRVTAKRG